MNITPKKGDNGTDWLAYIRTTWPIVVAIVATSAWFGNRIEGPEERQERMRGYLEAFTRIEKSLEKTTDKIDAHVSLPGHPVTLEQLRQNTARLDELRHDTKQILEKVNKGPS
jgi:hypothetical protein